MKTFLNCTQHPLNADQLAALSGMNLHEICDLKEINPVLFERLANTPGDEEAAKDLAMEFVQYLMGVLQENSVNGLLIHLPIGSPYFQAILMMGWGNDLFQAFIEDQDVQLVFSHSERVVSEQDGVKTSVFKFQKFLFF